MKQKPRSADRGTERRPELKQLVETQHQIRFWKTTHLNLFFHIIKDESLRMDEEVRGVERDGVQRAPVHAATVCWSVTRFGPDEALNRGHEGLRRDSGCCRVFSESLIIITIILR